MKKAKIMLMSIAVLAVVGGALAFKAHKLGTKIYCYSITNAEPAVGACTLPTTDASAKFTDVPVTSIFYTEVTQTTSCTSQLACPNPAETFQE